MKRFFYLCMLLAMGTSLWATEELTESFETGLPSTAPSAETHVVLSSGTWRILGVYGNTNNGSMRARMNTNGYLITPVLCQPGTISFRHRGSGNNKELVVEKSVDSGTTWTELGKVSVSSASDYGTSSFSAASKEEDTEVLIRFTCKSASVFIDDVRISLNTVTGSGGEAPMPDNPEPQDTIEWSGPHPTEHAVYIAPWGSDTGDGSWEHPYYNLQMAVDRVSAGDTIFVRGGTYYPTLKKDGQKTTVRIKADGRPDAWYTIKTFPGEFPVLNFKDQPKKVSVRGIELTGSYWHIYGIHITQAGDNGIKLEGSHNRIERCTFSYNDDTGLQLGFGHKFSDTHPGVSENDGTYCAYNDIIDCDSYLNCDADNYGSDADGFACKMHNGRGNRFIRCRAWDNADDAWDLYETDFGVQLIECWAWGSGRADLFNWVEASGSFQGNGNGIKLGGNGTGGSSKGIHEAWRCIAFNNNKTGSVKGFDENSHKGGVKLVNCLAFGNGYDYMFEDCASAETFSFYNNVCLGRIEIKGGFTDSNNALLVDPKNAWKNNAVTKGFSESDFISLSEEDAKAPRGIDGSLPVRFARLKSESALIDKGLDMKSELQDAYPFTWQPISGNARDLGPYEYVQEQFSGVQMLLTLQHQLSLRVEQGHVVFSVPEDGIASVEVLSVQGQILSSITRMLATGGAEYSFPLRGVLSTGVCLVRLSCGGQTKVVKVVSAKEFI